MREGFDDILRDYQANIRESAELEVPPDVQALIDRMARRARTYPETQQHIYDIQEEKAAIMDALHDTLREIDRGGTSREIPDDAMPVYGSADGSLDTVVHNRLVPVTAGALCTDAEWGMTYHLDPETVPRALRKRYAVETAKYHLRTLYDRQLLHVEAGRKTRYPGSTRFYKEMLSGAISREGIGNVAETMVRTFLKRIAIDHDVDFTVVEADILQDTKDKIDFIIHRKQASRGARVLEEDRRDVGIQFTTDTRPETTRHKTEQIEHARARVVGHEGGVDDIVLVSIPLNMTGRVFEEWKRHPVPGGPSALWSSEVAEQVVRGVLRGIVPEGEIERVAQSIAEAPESVS